MRTKGTNGSLGEILGSVVGSSHSILSRVIDFGVVVAVAVADVIAVASIPTTVGISAPSLVAPPVLVLVAIFFMIRPF